MSLKGVREVKGRSQISFDEVKRITTNHKECIHSSDSVTTDKFLWGEHCQHSGPFHSVGYTSNLFLNRIEKAQEKDNKWWYVLMLVFSIIFYLGSLISIILLYVFFTEV